MKIEIRSRLAESETLRASLSAGIMVATRVVGTLGTLVYTVLMARMMTPQDFGLAWTLWSAVFIAAYLTTLNIGATAIREVVHARTTGNDGAAAGFIIVSRRILLAVSVPVIAGFVGLTWWRNPDVIADHSVAVWLAAATIPVMGWNATNSAQAAALDQVLRSQVPPMLLRPLVFMATLGTMWAIGLPLGLETVIALYLIIVVLIAAVQFKLVWPHFDFMKSATADVTGWRRWLAAGLLLAPGRLLTDRLKDVLVLISAFPLGAVGVAQITVALSLINFLNFAINAVEMSFSPKTARSLARGLADGVAPRDMRRAIHFIAVTGVLKMAMVLGAVLVLWFLLPLIMRLFGPDYAAAAPATWCFILIPLANAVFGNTSLVMQIFDQRTEFFLTSLLALIALPIVGIYGVPIVIARGIDPLIATAGSFTATMVALQALRWALCLWRTGIDASFLGALIRRQMLKRKSP
jgi:O-antigen/teichoic acid export membrane protein